MGDFKNRCYGCEHYDGGSATSGTSSIRCAIGHKGVNVSSGCDDFEPDRTANCFQSCYYYYTK
ncbi:MAG TPA: hypothetical protein ENK66_10795 [Arcobacter sp.]|nr:hypothetical protein [Arcobacter sp.]